MAAFSSGFHLRRWQDVWRKRHQLAAVYCQPAAERGGVGKLQRHRHSVPGETVCSAERRQLGALSAVNEKGRRILPLRPRSGVCCH